MDLSIAIVSWNTKQLLENCLDSIYKNTKNITFETYVSDNDSKDGSADMVKEKFPQVGLIENKKNLGFPIANNQIIRKAKGKYVILLNPDTIVTKGSLETLIKFMEEHPEAGAVGPRLEYPDQSMQISCRTFPALETELYRALFLDQLFPKTKLFGKYLMTYWDHNDEREVDQPMGAALLVRAKAIEEIGLMDENIIFWFDEVDWCKRIKDKGWKIYFTPKSKIYHYKNKSFGQWKGFKKSFREMKIWRSSRSYYFKKFHGNLSVLALYLLDLIQISLVLAALYILIKSSFFLLNLVF